MKCKGCRHYYTYPYYNQINKISKTKGGCKIKGHREPCDIKDVEICTDFIEKPIQTPVKITEKKTRRKKGDIIENQIVCGF